ncbi:MAG TPA: methyltransferase domain-containing protein [Anaerolineales bacterium]|nr:methyltransferase domain-containing protein [Anaerolineales bacterium]
MNRGLRFWNEIIYRRSAPLYNAIDVLTLGVWWRLVRRALAQVPSGGRVLEVGFGPGKLHAALSAQSGLCVGLDLARGMCHFTWQRLLRLGLRPRIVQGDACHAPLRDATFDSVVSTFAVSGIPEGELAVREMARLARHAGSVVVVDIGLPTDGNQTGRFWAHLWERMGDYLYDQPALMASVGLRIVHFEEFGPGRHIRTVVGWKP